MTSKEGNLMMSLRYNNIPANFQTMHYIKCISGTNVGLAELNPKDITMKVITVFMEN